MRYMKLCFIASIFAATCSSKIVLAEDAVLLETAKFKITSKDFEASLTRIPAENRVEVLGSKARIAKMLEGMAVNRGLALHGREEGMDRSPLFRKQVELLEDGILSREWTDKQVNAIALPNFDARAKELYRLNEKKYEIPGQVHVSHILVKIKGGAKEDALLKTQAIRARLLQGESFEKLAEALSDDPGAKNNKGDLGFFEANKMVKPFADTAFAMSQPGSISEPVLSDFGYHLIQFHGAKSAKIKPYDEVKAEIIDGLVSQHKLAYRQGLVDKVKNDPSLKLNEQEINKFYVDLEAVAKKNPAEGK